MKVSDCIFWNVDTQFDFVSPDGKLYVPGAELLKPNWKKLTQLAKSKFNNSCKYCRLALFRIQPNYQKLLTL